MIIHYQSYTLRSSHLRKDRIRISLLVTYFLFTKNRIDIVFHILSDVSNLQYFLIAFYISENFRCVSTLQAYCRRAVVSAWIDHIYIPTMQGQWENTLKDSGSAR